MDWYSMELSCSEGLNFPNLPVVTDNHPEWEYRMRRSMQEIVPNLFLGPYAAASRNQLDVLLGYNITHIVCIRHPIEVNRIKPNFPDHFKYLVLEVQDSTEEQIIKYFPTVRDFLDECLGNGGRVLVHGNGGISRSASLVIAYLMETYGLPYNKAFCYVQQKRYCINPNEGFVRQLVEYEPIYLARHQMRGYSQQQQESRNLKRSFEVDDDGSEDEMNHRNSFNGLKKINSDAS